METKTQGRISKADFIQNGRDFVLAAMDSYVQEVVSHDKAKGWRDGDLPKLIPALDAHFEAIAARFCDPESPEPGSANIVFVE